MKASFLALLLTLSTLSAAQFEEESPNAGDVRVVPVEATPEPDYVETRVIFPETGEMKTETPIQVQVRVEGYPLGTNSNEFLRKDAIRNDSKGQSLHVFIDNLPYFAIHEVLVDSLDNEEDYYEEMAKFNIPTPLQPGMHVIRIIPARSFGEGLKGTKSFAASIFYLNSRKKMSSVNLSGPYLTYNEPQGTFSAGQPILLDYYLTNCQLSRDGYKIRLTIDGDVIRNLVTWQPWYIYGLKPGNHKVQLELLDPQNKVVPGQFNTVERTIIIK